MGCSKTYYCHNCKVEVYMGYQSYRSWIDAYDIASFQSKMRDLCKLLPDRENGMLIPLRGIRHFLTIHEGHDIGYYSEDYTTTAKDGSTWLDVGWLEPSMIVPAGYKQLDWSGSKYLED